MREIQKRKKIPIIKKFVSFYLDMIKIVTIELSQNENYMRKILKQNKILVM